MEKSGRPALVKIVRGENGHPIGVVVAKSKTQVGWSSLNRRDRWNKEWGLMIAANRAERGYNSQPPEKIQDELDRMRNRAKAYFDNPNPKHGPRAAK